MREPHIDDIVFRAGKQQISICVEFYLGQGPFVAWIKGLDGLNTMVILRPAGL